MCVDMQKFSISTEDRVRPTWHEYFVEMCYLVASRSTCKRRAVGAVLVKDNRAIATGYNGAPSMTYHCTDVGCVREELDVPSGERHELCRGIHAEQNAIIQCAKHGVSVKGATLYCTTFPCIICAKMIINSGIDVIYYVEGYSDTMSETMLKSVGIEVYKLGDKDN